MRCVICNRKGTFNRAKCWAKWKLCGECAVREHPRAYSKATRKIWTKDSQKTETEVYISKEYERKLKISPRFHTHCVICNASLEDKKYNTKYCSDSCRNKSYTDNTGKRRVYFKNWYKKKRKKVLKKINEKKCKLCDRVIHDVNPNKKLISCYCSKKCMKIDNHRKVRKKKKSETSVRIPLETWIELVREGRIKIEQ